MFDAEENIFSLKKKIWYNIRFESITFLKLFLLLSVYQKHDHIFIPVYDNSFLRIPFGEAVYTASLILNSMPLKLH